MAFVAVDDDGSEWIYKHKPFRYDNQGVWSSVPSVRLPSGSIRKLIGRELTWKDEPVELKQETK